MDDKNLLDFFREVNRLKQIKRTGWVERGVENAESVADHSFMVALQALVLGAERGLNMEKLLKMAIIHDIVESRAGDLITKEKWPECGTVTEDEKHAIERAAMEKLAKPLGKLGEEIMELWLGFEEGKTNEAIFMNSIDRLEVILQALEYKKLGNFKKPLDGFWDKKSIGIIKDEGIKNLVLKASELPPAITRRLLGDKVKKGKN